MNNILYLDRSATTPLCPEARTAMLDAMDRFGNPSSLHSLGVDAEHVVTGARKNILAALGVPNGTAGELVFTSCGTEANCLAILGTAYSKPAFRGRRIITSAAEHPSVLEPLKRLEAAGFEVVRVPCPGGVFDMDAFDRAMTREVFLVSVMTVNNETGAINDTASIFARARAVNPDVVTHTDAVQAFRKTEVSPRRSGAELITVSAHKIGGPKGVGALYVAPRITKTKSIVPVLPGGGQERGMRSGTENTVGIAGFGAAASAPACDPRAVARTRDAIAAALPGDVRINTPAGAFYPGIMSLTCPGVRSETMLHYLSSRGIFVSSGSACSSNGAHGSYVLADFGLVPRDADCTVRLSFDASLSDADVSAVAAAIAEGYAKLQKMR